MHNLFMTKQYFASSKNEHEIIVVMILRRGDVNFSEGFSLPNIVYKYGLLFRVMAKLQALEVIHGAYYFPEALRRGKIVRSGNHRESRIVLL